MDGKSGVTQRFFKIMLPGFHEKLVLPPACYRKLEEEKSGQAILTSHCGTTKINICKNNGLICFQEGWKDLADQNGLSIGDALVFEHTGGLRFNVVVFDPTACEKQFPQGVNINEHSKDDAQKEAAMDSSISCNSLNPCFVIRMKRHNASKRRGYVNVPMKFLRSNDLSKKTSAKLKDPCGKTWLVRLSFMNLGPHRIRCMLDKGWYKFYTSNKLKDGDVCVFELHPHSQRSKTVVMDVQINRASP